VVSLLTTRVENKALAAYVSKQSSASANLQMTTASLEVLACIAFKQTIRQAEIDHLFNADKRGLVVKLSLRFRVCARRIPTPLQVAQ
jgi:chromosome segregation and condensation protein ScpB